VRTGPRWLQPAVAEDGGYVVRSDETSPV